MNQAAAAIALLLLSMMPVRAQSLQDFAKESGAWIGNAIGVLEGKQIRMSCKGYMTSGELDLGLGIRCANHASDAVELRAAIKQTGARVSGTWEVRTFNQVGELQGTLRNKELTALVSGALKGNIVMRRDGANLRVSVDIAQGKLDVRLK